MDPKSVWRRIFQEFLIRDRVRIIAQGWVYRGQIGRVSRMMKDGGTQYYLVKLPKGIIERIHAYNERDTNEVGWFRRDQLEYVPIGKRSGPITKWTGIANRRVRGI